MARQPIISAALPSLGILLLNLLLLAIITIPTPTYAWTKRNDPHGKTIIAYYASWQWYDRNHLAKPSNLDHTKVTRYTFAFFQINSQGDIWGTDEWADAITLYGEFDWMYVAGVDKAYCSWDLEGEPPSCAGHHYETGLIYQAHEAGTEVYPSIGGWTLSDPFPALAANPAARKKFADNCVKLIETYDFDGIDIDWEYPTYADHSGTPDDTENYSLFLKEIREALDELGDRTGRFYGLTAALPCGPSLIDGIQIEVVKDYLTEFNLMTYDFHGSWNAKTGANAPLYDMEGSPEFSVHACVENWMAGGARPEQINIGLPFYGRSFAGSGLTSWGETHAGYADTITWADDEGSPQYFNIVDKLSRFTSVRDPVTQTQFMYNNQGFVSYDDERAICDKTEYVMDNDLNGYIIWEISGDLLYDKSTPLLDATNDRLNTNERCDPNDTVGDTVAGAGAAGVNMGASIIEGQAWYPSQSLGYCVSDGKELENFIKPSQIFGSPVACCVVIFSHNPDCTASSMGPGSDGQWVASSTTDDSPWYPRLDSRYCVKDGNEAQFHTPEDYKFSSAEACCNRIYSFEPSCVSWSLNPGSNGQWVDYVEESDPWYPHHDLGHCVRDGDEAQSFTFFDNKFSSAEACCDGFYSYNADCVSESTGVQMDSNTFLWYPNSGECTSESPVPSWIETTYSSKEECCLEYYGEFNTRCTSGVAAQTTEILVSNEPTPYPTPRPTKYSKPNPNNMDAYVVDPSSEFEGDPWYPHAKLGMCVNDGRHERRSIPDDQLFTSAQDCCEAVCVQNSDCTLVCLNLSSDETSVSEPTAKPKPDPNNMDAYIIQDVAIVEEPVPLLEVPTMNKEHQEALIAHQDALLVHQEALTAYHNAQQNALNEHLFYPNFGRGMSVGCTSGGKVPEWISQDMLESTEQGCCGSFSTPWSDQCLNNPYYPNFQDDSCRSDGSQPSWMGGDYLSGELWLCCLNFFRESDRLGECAGLRDCDGCDLAGYITAYYSVLDSQGRDH